MSELTPITRIEEYLDAIVDSGTPPLDPVTRVEIFLDCICNNQVCTLTPITRIEMFLAKISGASVTLPEPVTRIELYLAAIAGEAVELPDIPITRIEEYLADWVESGEPEITLTGAIVEFITQRAHPLKELVVNIEPQQDLHGYDSPWPAGGGVNKLPAEYTESITLNKVFTFATPLPAGTYTFSFVSADTSSSVDSYQIGRYKDESEAWTYTAVNPTTKYATFTNVEPCSKLVVFSNKAYSESTGFTTVFTGLMLNSGNQTNYSPYSNECPISGWTGVEANRTGKNLLQNGLTTRTLNGTLFTVNEDKSVTISGTPTATARVPIKTGLVCAVKEPMIFATGAMRTGTRVFARRILDGVTTYPTISPQLNLTLNAEYYDFYIETTTSYDGTPFTIYPQLELGSTATAYEEFRGNSYSVTFGETVFGAKPDIINGETPVTWVKKVFNGSENWAKESGGGNYYSLNFASGAYVPSGSVGNYICNYLAWATGSSTNVPNTIRFGNTNPNKLYVILPSFADNLADFKSYLASNNIEICYMLAAPTQTTITPTPITTLKGYNAVWSNAGPVEVIAYGTPIPEPNVPTRQALNLLLGGAYRNGQTGDDVSDEEALNILLGGADR